MDAYLTAFLKWTPAVIILCLILWAGAHGYWYWGQNARAVIADMRRQRDEWRNVALALLREKGITLPNPPPDAPPPPAAIIAARPPGPPPML